MNRLIVLGGVKKIEHAFGNFNWLYVVIIGGCFLPFVSPAIALSIGIVLSLFGVRHENIHTYTAWILQLSIVLLGFGMNLGEVINASKNGLIETVISVTSVMLLGILLGRLFRVEKNTSILIAAGTAICGGSAIAAIAPILRSENHQNLFALIVVLVLNAVALLLFPWVGQELGLFHSPLSLPFSIVTIIVVKKNPSSFPGSFCFSCWPFCSLTSSPHIRRAIPILVG